MKILHLTTHLNIGGISSYLLTTGLRFVKMGHSVSVVSAGGNLKSDLETKGIRCFDFPIRTKNEFHPKVFLALLKLVRLVKKERFDVIHAHTRVAQVLGSLAARFTKAPLVTTCHGFFKRRLSRRIFGCWGKLVIAISPLVAEDLEKNHKVAISKIRVVQNAVDIEDFEKRLSEKNSATIRRAYGIPDRATVIGSVSRLVKDKGHHYLIEAVHDLRKRKLDLYLLIVGDGRERRNLESLARKSGLKEQVRLVESKPDITELLSIMDIFAHPATYREGFGLSMVEAMIAKKPVVATNIWAVNTIIRNHVNGFLIEPKKKEALAEAIGFILENPKLTQSIVENAYQAATQLYSMDRMVSELETVYQEAIEK